MQKEPSNPVPVRGSPEAKTMRLSIVEGCFGIGSNAIGDNFFIPFSLAIGATPYQVGIFTALPGLVSPAGQVAGSHLMNTKGRGAIIKHGITGMFLSTVLVMVMAIVAMLDSGTWATLAWFMLAFYTIYTLCAGLMGPAWVSTMGDIVPADRRGRYFSSRNLITSLVSMIMALALSWWLQVQKDRSTLLPGDDASKVLMNAFVVLFTIHMLARLVSRILFQFHHYPPMTIAVENRVTLRGFLRDLPRTNFGHFTVLVSLITFGQWIAGSFFSVYMLTAVKDGGLGFDYVTFVFMNVMNAGVAIVFFPIAGKFGDKHGNVRLMRIGAIIVPILPVLWIFFDSPLSIALGPQLLGGIGWTAFNLATSNFIYDNVPAQKRGAYVAYYALIVGIGQLGGGLLGSILIVLFPPAMLGPGSYFLLFLLSGVSRAFFVGIYLPRIKEINSTARPIFNVKSNGIYKVIHDRLLRGNGKDHEHDESQREERRDKAQGPVTR